jgi:hypothetical protein
VREHGKQREAAERQQRAGRDAKPTRWNHLMGGWTKLTAVKQGEEDECGKDERAHHGVQPGRQERVTLSKSK